MKYIVKLRKTLEKTAVVEANSKEEADEKLKNEETVFSVVKSLTKGYYNGWDFQEEHNRDMCVKADDDVICNIVDFAKWYGCEPERVERALYKYTNCGMACNILPDRIVLTGYVEGMDGDMPTEELFYPFTESEARKTIERLDSEACKLWREYNEDFQDITENTTVDNEQF